MGNHLTEVYRPLVCLCERLNQLDIPWLVGGSTSCLLQKVGLDRKPNDLDVYTDCRYLDQIEPFLLIGASSQSSTARRSDTKVIWGVIAYI